MSQLVFLLDKNVFHSALACNELCRRLIEQIFSNCHKIVVSPSLSNAYWEILNQRGSNSKSHYPNLAGLLNMMTHDPRKCEWVPQEEAVPGEELMHKEEDRFMPRIAYGRAVTIVSNSHDDRRRVKAWAKKFSSNTKVSSPQSAVRQASKSCA